MQEKIHKLKETISHYKNSYTKLFLKQGSFSLYYSKEVDNFIKKAFHLILEDFFEDFLPDDLPLCVLAHQNYADFKLCAYEALPLLFVYKDIRAYHLKPMMKAFIALLNDLGFVINHQICELNGFHSKVKEGMDFLNIRYLCGSKALFKSIKAQSSYLLSLEQKNLAQHLLQDFAYKHIPFLKQEFNIKNVFGGLKEYSRLFSLLLIFKDSPKNKALEFIDENQLSELRLAVDFLFSLKSALNIQSAKDEDNFLLLHLDDLSHLLQKKDKKTKNAHQVLLQKSLSSLHTIGLYVLFLSSQIAKQYKLNEPEILHKKGAFFSDANNKLYKNETFKNLSTFLEALNALEDEKYDFDISLVFVAKAFKAQKTELEKLLKLFLKLLRRKYSFSFIKLFFDSALLSFFIKPLASTHFLLSEEGELSLDENALLCLFELEKNMSEFEDLKALSVDEKMMIKLSVLLSSLEAENAISLANIYRSYCVKLQLNFDLIEFGLKICKNFNAMKDAVQKEDIYNETIIFTLICRLENVKILRLIYALSIINARALKINEHFFYKSLDKLFSNAMKGFEDVNYLDETARRVKKEQTLKRTRIFLEQSPLLQDKISHIVSNLFIIKNSFEDIIKISKEALQKDFSFHFDNEKNLILEMIAYKNFDIAALLSILSSLNLIFMSFFQLFDEKIYLKFEYSNLISDAQKEKLYALLNQKLQIKANSKLKKPNIKKDELKFDLAYSKNYVKLNLNTKDQQGLMAFVMNEFKNFDLNLSAAKIQTIRGRTRNSFYFQKNAALLEKKEALIRALISE